MKKNNIIIVFAVLVVMFGLYGFAQKVKADQEAERARLAEAVAVEQKEITDVEAERAKLAESDALLWENTSGLVTCEIDKKVQVGTY